ncbi:unnamed protein product, partial [Schistosoma margrebowiei]
NEVNSSSDHQLSLPVKSTSSSSSTSTNTTTTATDPSNNNNIASNTTDIIINTTNKSLNFVQVTNKEVIVNTNNSLKSSNETNVKQSYSSFGAVSRAVKELEITANPLNNNNNSITTTNTTTNNNGNMVDLKIVRRFQTLGMNQLTETTCVNRPLINGYPNEKPSSHRGPLSNSSNRLMVSRLQEIFESGNTKSSPSCQTNRTNKTLVSVIHNNNNNSSIPVKLNTTTNTTNCTTAITTTSTSKRLSIN